MAFRNVACNLVCALTAVIATAHFAVAASQEGTRLNWGDLKKQTVVPEEARAFNELQRLKAIFGVDASHHIVAIASLTSTREMTARWTWRFLQSCSHLEKLGVRFTRPSYRGAATLLQLNHLSYLSVGGRVPAEVMEGTPRECSSLGRSTFTRTQRISLCLTGSKGCAA